MYNHHNYRDEVSSFELLVHVHGEAASWNKASHHEFFSKKRRRQDNIALSLLDSINV
jgi:hypothetical protein